LIYIDTSVVLAQLLAEDERPPPSFWSEPLLSSRLLEVETWTRIHARRLAESHGDAVRDLLGRVSFLELSPIVQAAFSKRILHDSIAAMSRASPSGRSARGFDTGPRRVLRGFAGSARAFAGPSH
jgi:hypothetical protein